MANRHLRKRLKKISLSYVFAAAAMTCSMFAPAGVFAEEAKTAAETEEMTEVVSEESEETSEESILEETTEESEETTEEETSEEETEEEATEEETQLTPAEAAVYETSQEEIKGHRLIAESDTMELYLKESNLSVIIRDKETGAIMESTVDEPDSSLNATWNGFIQSGIGFRILNGLNEERTDLATAQAEISVSEIENGFSAEVTLQKYAISFRLNVWLEDNELVAEIPNDSIKEETENVTIGCIYVYPMLGHTYMAEREGYLFVPDGNGALIYLEDNDGRFSSPLTLKVWGDNVGVDESYVLSLFWDEYQTINDSENVLAPVFGMVHTDTEMAMLGIIEDGAVDAKIIAYPNGAVTNYNWITPEFTMRRIYKQLTNKQGTSSVQLQEDKRTEYDIRVRYIFSNGADADYAGMANEYRNYLLNQEKLSVSEQDFRVRLDFLGTDKENGMISTKTVEMATTDQIREIYDDLEAAGVTDILSVYKGWQKNGIWSMPVTKFKADSAVGGNSGLKKLCEEAEEDGIEFYLYHDALRANSATVNTVFNVIKKLDESVYQENTYKEIYESFYYQTPQKAKERLESALKSYEKAGIDHLALTGITDHLFSYNYSGTQYSRKETYDVMQEMLAESAQGRNLALENPFSCYWEYGTALLNIPVNSSNYIFTDEEIPFLSIALKGLVPMYADYTNFEADKSQYFLELAETGIYPSFYLTWEDPVKLLYTNSNDLYTSQYRVYREEIIEYYQKLKEIDDQVKGATIIDRERFGDDVVEVTYSNGVKLYVNYSENDVTHDGVALEAMSYKVGESR